MQTAIQNGQRSLQQIRRQQKTTTPPRPNKSPQPKPPSRLIESANRAPILPDECTTCHGLGLTRADAPVGHPDFGRLVPCHCTAAEYNARQNARLAQISGLLPEELSLTLSRVADWGNCTQAMIATARQFVAQPRGFLTLWGGVGNGKTLILMAIINELRETHGLITAYIRFKDLIDHVRAGLDAGFSGDRQRYDYLKTVPILAIDEIDKTRITDYADEFRTAFLDDRYRAAIAGHNATIFALNSDPADLRPDISDRLRDGRFTIFHNTDPSIRPAMEWEK